MRAAAPRWAISFADLGLVLLGCFVMLHAMEAARPKAADAAPATAAAPRVAGTSLAASDLFEPGEARLTDAAKARLQALARSAGGPHWIVASRGIGEGGQRLDRFELAAARAAAVARTLQQSGVAENRLSLSLDEGASGGQRILISRR
jgi:flagellar motor protein MotB